MGSTDKPSGSHPAGYFKNYYATHREEMLLKGRERYAANRDRYLEIVKSYKRQSSYAVNLSRRLCIPVARARAIIMDGCQYENYSL